jgi:hypothetical protein
MSDGPRSVWLGGALRPAREAGVSVFDRGLTLGDGVFETVRARGSTRRTETRRCGGAQPWRYLSDGACRGRPGQ